MIRESYLNAALLAGLLAVPLCALLLD